MTADARQRLAAAQAGLLRALVGHAPPPPGLDDSQVAAAAEALLAKRRHAVARAWPSLIQALGARFQERFDAFARSAPLPSLGGPLADGRAFVRALARERPLPEAVLRQALAVDLRWAWQQEGLVPRRGLSGVQAVLPTSHRRLIGVRWAGLFERWFSWP
jgi:hypothetical protein